MKLARSLSFALALCVLALALSATPVFASPIGWSGEKPQQGEVVSTSSQAVSVDASCADGLAGQGQIRVDGVLLPTRLTYAPGVGGQWVRSERWDDDLEEWVPTLVWTSTPDLTRATLTAYGNAAADGTHTVAVTLASSLGVGSTDSWTFSVKIAPTLADPVPAPGSTVSTTSPVIEVSAADNSVIASCAASVNGVAASASYSSSTGKVLVIPSTPLAADSQNSVTVTVFDGVGMQKSLTWTFTVQGYPDMFSTVGDCDSCHPGLANDVNMGADCSSCHPSSHTGAPSSYHVSADVSACQPCHVSSLPTEHARWVDGSGSAITCLTCHGSTDPTVQGAIAASDSSCFTCHAGSANHEAFHATTVPPACVGCHPGTSLTSIHLNASSTLTCGSCHQSSDPKVTGAIAHGRTDCVACHDVVNPHGTDAATHTATMTAQWVPVLSHQGGEQGLSVACSMCHASTDLIKIHGGECGICHSGSRPAASFAAWNGSCQQGACHPSIHAPAEAAHDAAANQGCDACHAPDWSVTSASCHACHSISTSPPQTTADIGGPYIGGAQIQLTADGVHWTYYRLDGGPQTSGRSLLVLGPATGTRTHRIEYWSVSDSGLEETPHRTAQFDITADTRPPLTRSDVKSAYVGLAVIDLSSQDDGSIPLLGTYYTIDGGPRTAGTRISVPQPANGSQTHTITFWSIDGSGNEELPHNTATFTVTADTTAPVTTSTAPQYDRTSGPLGVYFTAIDPSPDSGVAATYVSLNGDVASATNYVSITSPGVNTLEFWSVDKAGNVETPHKRAVVVKDPWPPTTTSDVKTAYVGSAAIHLAATDKGAAGVASTHYQLDAGSDSIGTSLTVPAPGTHTLKFWSVDNAGNAEAAKTATFTVIAVGADTTPPVTTSNAVSDYNGVATITLTPVDAGSGVASTYFKLDGGAQTASRTVVVPGPATGSQAHTLEFWSVDLAGNEEQHHTVSFNVSCPVGTIVFRWDSPPPGAWANFYIDGTLVASRAMPSWDGIYSATVPVRSAPYALRVYWLDPYDPGYPVWSDLTATIDSTGKVVTLTY